MWNVLKSIEVRFVPPLPLPQVALRVEPLRETEEHEFPKAPLSNMLARHAREWFHSNQSPWEIDEVATAVSDAVAELDLGGNLSALAVAASRQEEDATGRRGTLEPDGGAGGRVATTSQGSGLDQGGTAQQGKTNSGEDVGMHDENELGSNGLKAWKRLLEIDGRVAGAEQERHRIEEENGSLI